MVGTFLETEAQRYGVWVMCTNWTCSSTRHVLQIDQLTFSFTHFWPSELPNIDFGGELNWYYRNYSNSNTQSFKRHPVCTDKVPAVFWCAENGVSVLLSTIVRKRMYVYEPYNACRYDVVLEQFLYKYSVFSTVKWHWNPCYLYGHKLREQEENSVDEQ